MVKYTSYVFQVYHTKRVTTAAVLQEEGGQPYQSIEEVNPTEPECGFLLGLVKERRESDECHECHLLWEMSFMPSLSSLLLVLHTTAAPPPSNGGPSSAECIRLQFREKDDLGGVNI